jgi:hypothetical protein
VSDPDPSFPGSDPMGTGGSLRTADDVITRAQRLIDAPEPFDGYPLGWHFEALNVGDLTAIATASLREHPATGPG